MITVAGSIMVESMMTNSSFLRGKSNRAKPYPIKVLESAVKRTVGMTNKKVLVMKVLKPYCPVPFQPERKAPKTGFFGSKPIVVNISSLVLNAAPTIHNRG